MSTKDTVLWTIVKFLQLNKVYRWVLKDILPDSITDRFTRLKLSNAFIPLVDAKEIERQFKASWSYLIKANSLLGSYLEFGVSYGSSLKSMHRVLDKFGLDTVRIFGFDSFEGMPETAAKEDHGKWKPGQFACSLETTKKHLHKSGIEWSRTFLIKGWFQTLSTEIITSNRIVKASVIMIDCKIYSSALLSLNFCKSLITDQAIIFFNDWYDDKEYGEHKAFIQFLQENPHLKSERFGKYKPAGKVFLITNTDPHRD